MENVRSLQDVHKLFIVEKLLEMRPSATYLASEQNSETNATEEYEEVLVAPLYEGQKVSFHIGDTKMREICDLYKLTVDRPHQGCEMVVIHIVLDEEATRLLKEIDETAKKAFREIATAQQWIGLVRTLQGVKSLPVDILLEAEAPTQLWFNSPQGAVEGYGLEFLTQHIGSVENLKDYACNVTLEFDWVTQKGEGHRLRIKAHSAVFQKKTPGNKTLKRSVQSVTELFAANATPRLVKRR
jgi:hypothetical protein